MSEHDHRRGSPTNKTKEKHSDREENRPSSAQNDDSHKQESEYGDKGGGSDRGSDDGHQHQNYDDIKFEPVDPENFDTKSFFSNIDALSHKLHSDSLRSFDTETEFDGDELKAAVAAVTVSMENFKNYSMHTQAQLEKLREQVRDVKDRMYRKQSQHPYDRGSDQRMSLEERELEAKIQNLNKELSKATEELTRAQQMSVDSEKAATEASLVAEQAAEEAKKIQEEYEARRKIEIENRKREEERLAREERQREENEMREEERRKAEEIRKGKLRKDEQATPDWENWPTFTYRIEKFDFEQGIGCIIRGDPNHFRESMISCKVVNPLDSEFAYEANEELVSNILELGGDEQFKNQAYVLIPHCTSRASAMNREPVIKAQTSDGWIELKSHEVVLHEFKDIKFVQAELQACTKLAVVTRFKRDFLTFTKRGGTVHSNVDQRVTFTVPRGCFVSKEHFVLQLQPVDSTTINEIRLKTQRGKDLLATSAFISSEWTTEIFNAPIVVNVPVPPNPVKAKKAAAARAAKEAKMKNPHSNIPPPADDEAQKQRKEKRNAKASRSRAAQGSVDDEEVQVTKKPTKWYMGQYGVQEEDENDVLFLAYKDLKGRWSCPEDKIITQVRLDLVELELEDPNDIDKFIVLRMKTSAEASDALEIVKLIETRLTEKNVNVVLKQRSDNPYEAIIEVVLQSKLEKVQERLEKEGYDDGPAIGKEIVLKEGDHLGIGFRSNIKCADKETNLDFIFNSQLSNTLQFEISEVNKYLQKNHNVYMGCVQVMRKTPTVCVRTPKKDKKKTAAEKKAAEQEKEEEGEEEADEEDIPQTYIEFVKELLHELLVTIPKEQELLEPVTVKKAPVTLRNRDDVINEDTLRTIARELGVEWQKVSYHLNVRKTRIQAILRNTMAQEKGEDDAKFEMLMNWAKKVPKSVNKVEVLRYALTNGGREDLADDLKDMDDTYQRQRRGKDV